jgi:uncharacterized membrane protein YqaE (UPF0057 family)
MKKISLLSLLAVIAFSSCKMAGDLQVEKRHYGKGYYVHVRDNHSEAVVTENKTSTLPLPENAVAVNTKNTATNEKINTTIENKNSIVEPRAKAENSKHTSVLSRPENKNVNPVKAKVQKIVATAKKSSSASSGDTNEIILVILAILISPLAVYLKEGVTTRFWIDLLCWIFGGGLAFSPFFYGGLLLLFAIVFALLIVLDSI